ncbi:MAG: septum formation initiator family protein [Kiritimatiellae bacterium]|nr:septum formation initiator family protein [Kiritimatiellia bacterium]
MKFWLTLYRIASVVFAAVVIIAVISAFLPKIRQNQERQRKITALDEENRRKEEEVQALRRQQELFTTDPKHVERLAREELGKTKSGETIYRFSEKKTNTHLKRRQ